MEGFFDLYGGAIIEDPEENVEGIDGFSFTVVERCRINELDRKEQRLIDIAYDDENCANKQRTVTHQARRTAI